MKSPAPAIQIATISLSANVLLSCGKLIVGLWAHSGALVSDAVHSAADVLANVVVMAGIGLAGQRPDEEHPYGHERMECVAAIVLAGVLFFTAMGIGLEGISKLAAPSAVLLPGKAALIVAAISVLIKEGLFRFTRAAGRRYCSGALIADAWHHRSDALASLGVFAGILGARLGAVFLEPVAQLVVCLFICKAAYDIFKDAVDKMVDKACSPQVCDAVRTTALTSPGVLGVDSVKSRLFGSRVYLDIEIEADGNCPLTEVSCIANHVKNAVETDFPEVKQCAVLVNPAQLP